MTEEEYFRKNYPDSCYGDKPLSPHWDFFQDGVEFGERQSENEIKELKKENAELKADNDARKFAMTMSEKVEKQLREENAELKCECRRCVHTDCPCTLSDYGKDKNGICDHFKDVFDENARLKEINTHTLSQLNLDNGELIIQLTKAKELLKKLYLEIRGYMNDQGFDMNVINEVYDFIKSEVEK